MRAPAKLPRAPSRVGKKALVAYFSPELIRALNVMAINECRSLQALTGIAIDLLLKSRGKPPANER